MIPVEKLTEQARQALGKALSLGGAKQSWAEEARTKLASLGSAPR